MKTKEHGQLFMKGLGLGKFGSSCTALPDSEGSKEALNIVDNTKDNLFYHETRSEVCGALPPKTPPRLESGLRSSRANEYSLQQRLYPISSDAPALGRVPMCSTWTQTNETHGQSIRPSSRREINSLTWATNVLGKYTSAAKIPTFLGRSPLTSAAAISNSRAEVASLWWNRMNDRHGVRPAPRSSDHKYLSS